MIEPTEQRVDLKPDWLAADLPTESANCLHGCWARALPRTFASGKDIHRLMACSPVTNTRTNAERDVYVCPNGKLLRTSGTVHGRARNYQSQPQECRTCTLKRRCTRAPFKKIARDINEVRVTIPGRSRARPSSSDRAMRARKQKCALHI